MLSVGVVGFVACVCVCVCGVFFWGGKGGVGGVVVFLVKCGSSSMVSLEERVSYLEGQGT